MCDRLNNDPQKMVHRRWIQVMPESLGTFEYVTLQSKRDFADLMKVTDLKIENCFEFFQVRPI